MKDYTKEILRAFKFDKAIKNVENGLCATCCSDKTKREDFKDFLSWKEFQQSGMCQKCQDKTFSDEK